MTPMFQTIAQYAALDPHYAHAWWSALTTAQWSVARSWLADVRYFDQQPRPQMAQLDAVLPFLQTVSTPQRVIAVVEALVQEQRLTHEDGSAITDRVLACVNRQGEWCWSPEPTAGEVPGSAQPRRLDGARR